MRVLLDECVPERLRHTLSDLLPAVSIETARFAGLSHLSNGALLAGMAGRYDVLVTTDKRLRYQQNIDGRAIAVVTITSASNDIDALRPLMSKVAAVLSVIKPGSVADV